MKLTILILLSALLPLQAMAAPDDARILRFYGYARDAASGKYLYTEVYRQEFREGRWVGGDIRYYAPDGSRLGAKKLDFSASPYIPVYTLDLPSSSYAEGISAVNDDSVSMFKVTREHGRQAASLRRVSAMAADSGFHNYLVDHMDELLKGKTVRFRFGAAGQLDAYNFRARMTGRVSFDGRPAIRLVAEPDSMIRFLVDPLKLTYDPASRQLLEYRGMSNVVDPASGKVYKNVRIAYPERPPPDAPSPLPPLE
jgi:hypothetical protein